jgi:aspartate racemase
MEKIVGILGGMGPEATVDLMRRIIAGTDAKDDIDHIRCIVDNNPKVPSRIKALLEGGGESPAPCMADMAKRLETWGADCLAIACNTAHNYYPDVQGAVAIPVLNMIELASVHAVKHNPGCKRVGVLASPAVRLTRLYTDVLEKLGVEAVYPDIDYENRLLGVIKNIKAGDTGPEIRKEFAAIVENVGKNGAEIAIIACTELGIICEEYSIPVVDAADVLAFELIRFAQGK